VNLLGRLLADWLHNGRWTARGSVFDVGNTTRDALQRILAGASAERAGGDAEGDNGNGSLMRILPVALRFSKTATPPELARLAMRASAITHGHVRSRLACACYCLIAQQIIRVTGADAGAGARVSAREAVGKGVENFLPLLDAHPNERIHFSRIRVAALAGADSDSIRSGGYVMDTLEAALWCLLHHDTFAATVLAAVNLGGDTDTTGCVAGGLAGLLYGCEAIPADWIGALPKRDDIGALLDRFIATTNSSR
jgi:ADP-ribosylglycohydrolase